MSRLVYEIELVCTSEVLLWYQPSRPRLHRQLRLQLG
jgi:hypothetical protein